MDDRGGGEVGGCTHVKGVWPDPHNGVFISLPGSDPDGNRRQLAGGIRKKLRI